MKVNIHTHHPKKGESTITSIGIHPYDAQNATTDRILAIERQALTVDAIGEIGLDYCCSTDKEAQLLAFQAQLEVAQHTYRGVLIHCVKAFEPIMKILDKYTLKFVIFHGFIGSAIQARRATDKGYYLSFGERSFRSAKTIDAMKTTPVDKLFFETDDSHINIDDIYTKASTILGIPIALLEYITTENFNKICG